MKLLHTADLHLDSPFSSSSLFTADKRREEQRAALGRIFELAVTEGCDMILIAGDLFDGRYVTPETTEYIKALFARAAVPVIIAPGNHDPFVKGSFYQCTELPENVYVFSSSELQCFDFPELGVSVFGYAFTSPSLSESPLCNSEQLEQNGNIRLLCAHADLSSPISRYCPVTVGDIASLGVSYAALGHIHCRDADDSFGTSVIRYCGFAEGRSFDELGEGGVFIVEIDDEHKVTLTKRIVSAHRYEIAELDVSRFADRSEMISAISSAARVASKNKPTHLRLILNGTADVSALPDLPALEYELCEEGLLSLEIVNDTLPTTDIASLQADPSLRGEFYRALYSGLTNNDPQRRHKHALALQIGLSAIEGRKIPEVKEEL